MTFRLLLGGWAPAAFVLAARAADDHLYWTVVLAVAGVAAVVSVLTLLRPRETTNAKPYTLVGNTDESSQVPAYLLTYVFPFLFLDLDIGGVGPLD